MYCAPGYKCRLHIIIRYINHVYRIYRSWIQIQIYVSYTCSIACILASSYPQFHVHVLVSLHSYILIFLGSYTLGTCWYPRILTSSYPQVYVCLFVTLYPSSYLQVHVLCVLVGILASSHPHILKFMYPGCLLVSLHRHILISSYPQVHVPLVLIGILASSHPHSLRFMQSGFLLVPSHPHIPIPLKANNLNKWAALSRQFFLIALRQCLL